MNTKNTTTHEVEGAILCPRCRSFLDPDNFPELFQSASLIEISCPDCGRVFLACQARSDFFSSRRIS